LIEEMTREQFITRSRRAQKILSWASWVWMAWFIGVMGLVTYLLPSELRNKPVFEDWRLAVGGLSHLLFSLAILFWGIGLLSRRHGVTCSECGKIITGSQIVIASANCGHCGSSVLETQTSSF
jgi:hypothetical protein